MPPITALLNTENDGLRLGRCLETLYACDEILVIERGSVDDSVRVARQYGAKIVYAQADATSHAYAELVLQYVRPGWILCLDARESLTESLATSLLEWKALRPTERAYSVFLREETAAGWVENPTAETRLVPADWNRWMGRRPVGDPGALPLDGALLRFAFP
jgi:hypothetical protein